ncbi:hypothetical protein HPB51_021322 [Rhipicephalus microplus]|uniref:Uncharacterized protein n=1 Tax=Rhipicephalus microplus TaxID=6941 RepID=A0A9J6F651_RHIMP|nr:hypothetical protein HPB51_021322 [Rhipicephalus microplus]
MKFRLHREVNLYYNTLLYGFYQKYDATQGRAFDVDDPLHISTKRRKRELGDETPAGARFPVAQAPGAPTSGVQTFGDDAAVQVSPAAQTSGSKTPSGARTPGGRPASRKQGKPKPGDKTPKRLSPPSPGVRAGKGSATPRDQCYAKIGRRRGRHYHHRRHHDVVQDEEEREEARNHDPRSRYATSSVDQGAKARSRVIARLQKELPTNRALFRPGRRAAKFVQGRNNAAGPASEISSSYDIGASASPTT